MITVIAGVNGAGKSSMAGANLRHNGADYFNPDEVSRDLRADNPGLSEAEANGEAWQMGYEQLLRAIDEGRTISLKRPSVAAPFARPCTMRSTGRGSSGIFRGAGIA